MCVRIRKHVAHIAAHGRVNALRHEQRSSEITPLAPPIQMGAHQALAKLRKLSRDGEYQDNDEYEDEMTRLDQGSHFVFSLQAIDHTRKIPRPKAVIDIHHTDIG